MTVKNSRLLPTQHTEVKKGTCEKKKCNALKQQEEEIVKSVNYDRKCPGVHGTAVNLLLLFLFSVIFFKRALITISKSFEAHFSMTLF